MANVANLVLKDGVAATLTFTPETVVTGEKATWVERTLGSFALTRRFFLGRKVSTSTQNSGKREVTCILKLPYASAAVGSDPLLAGHTLIANLVFTIPNQASLAQRKDLWAAMKESFVSSQLQNAVETDEMPW
jgi:hypothetical protein